MKRISHTSRSRDNTLHIETDLGIVNIRVGLYDGLQDCPVESIEIIPDKYAGETPVIVDGSTHVRLIRGGKAPSDVPTDEQIRQEIIEWVNSLDGNGLVITDDDLLDESLYGANFDSLRDLFKRS